MTRNTVTYSKVTGFALSWALSDEELVELTPAPAPSTCAHVWGVPYRTGYLPGVIGNLYQRDCRHCRAWQVWRGTQWGRLTELVRECA
jgi:hypothetical protein